jgi:chloramphenicol O-acetyltransferase type A
MEEFDVIDLDQWKRKALFQFYETYDDPTWDILADVRITRFYAMTRREGYSFFLAFVHAASRACNSIEEFRLRIGPAGEVRRYPIVHPGSTVLHDDGTFGFAYFRYKERFSEWLPDARARLEAAKQDTAIDPREEDLARLYFTPVPWITFRGFRHPQRRGYRQSIPMIIFGKHVETAGERTMPVGLTLHHGLADGFHAGLFFSRLQAMLDDPDELFSTGGLPSHG